MDRYSGRGTERGAQQEINRPEDDGKEYRMLYGAESPYNVDYGYIYAERRLHPMLAKGLRFLAALGLVFLIVCILPKSAGDSLANHMYPDNSTSSAVNPVAEATETAAPSYNMDIPRVAELVSLIDEYPSAALIAENIWRFPLQLVDLALKNYETIDYVAEYLEYGKNTYVIAESIDVSQEMAAGAIPQFIQWDTRWGYSKYNTEVMGLVGCGPTALAMVAAGLTGNAGYNPRHVADFSHENGYVTADNSTTWTLMSQGSAEYGLTARELTLDGNAITTSLRNGEPIICSMGPGDFTTSGHFIVLTGVTDEGKITILDPNSRINSEIVWDLQLLMSQMKNLWAYTLS